MFSGYLSSVTNNLKHTNYINYNNKLILTSFYYYINKKDKHLYLKFGPIKRTFSGFCVYYWGHLKNPKKGFIGEYKVIPKPSKLILNQLIIKLYCIYFIWSITYHSLYPWLDSNFTS